MCRWLVAIILCLLMTCGALAAQEVGDHSQCNCQPDTTCDESSSLFVGRQCQIVDGQDPIWHVLGYDALIMHRSGSTAVVATVRRLGQFLLRVARLAIEPEDSDRKRWRSPPAL